MGGCGRCVGGREGSVLVVFFSHVFEKCDDL